MVERHTYDSIIIGGGLAGLRASLELGSTSKVAIISKCHPVRSNSVAAQGGINAAMAQDDSWEIHMEDTVKGGAYLNDQDAVELLVKNAKKAIIELENYGALFSRDKNRQIAQRRLGGQTRTRSCYAADNTGQTLLHTLYEQALKKGVKILDEQILLRVVVQQNRCKGAICLDIKTGKIMVYNTKSVMLATGGYARMYGVSSNNAGNTGDAQAIMLREGLALQDMEFVQFHPTGLYPSGILIGEAARGYGGVLLNDKSERFMHRYDDRMEMASRDIVSKAIQKEIQSGRGIKQNEYVYLDLKKINQKIIKEKIPQIRELGIDFAGIDCLDQPLPVKPTAHYSMGGIPTDKKARVLSRSGEPIVGLYAAGECTCISVHGANRVGGNSLLETVVFGKVAGKEMATYNFGVNPSMMTEDSVKDTVVWTGNLRKKNGPEKLFAIRSELAQLMDKKVGVFRDQRGLYGAKDKIRELKGRFENVGLADHGSVYNSELVEAIELRNMLDVAETVVHSALSRKESRGAHNRTDYPSTGRDGLTHTMIVREGGQLVIDHKNIIMKNIRPK